MASKISRAFSQPKVLREVRIFFCPEGSSSEGVRTFLQNNYETFKKEASGAMFLVRESRGIEPTAWARYDFGKEHNVSLKNSKPDAVLGKLKDLISK